MRAILILVLFANRVQRVANGTISGFHVGDELCWGGLPYSNMSAVATAIGNTAWPGAEARLKKAPLILYVNEGTDVVLLFLEIRGLKYLAGALSSR